MNLDTRIAAGVAGLYLLLCAVLLPLAEAARALGGGIVVFVAITVIAHHVPRGPVHGLGILAVAFASIVVLAYAMFPTMRTHPVAVPLWFLGVQAAALLWSALRWSPLPPAASRTSLRKAWAAGWFMAVVLSAVATLPIVFLLVSGEPGARRILWVYPAYFIGLTAAATVYWLLQRIAHLATGRYLAGFLGGVCVYGAVAPLLPMFIDEPVNPMMLLGVAVMAGGLVGPGVLVDTTKDPPGA